MASQISNIQQQQWPRLIAVLVNIFGAHNLQLAEDVLQDAFAIAWQEWRKKGVPEHPSAWLITAARNKALDAIRRKSTASKHAEYLSHQTENEWHSSSTLESAFTEDQIQDDQLRMLFCCCQKEITSENRLPFMLKHLCGLSVQAIAESLLTSPSTIKKRLVRTKQKFQTFELSMPEDKAFPRALDSVHTALYLLFNQGFHASQGKSRINLMLCKDALGLMKLLSEENAIANQDTFGLRALMFFQISRVNSRVDSQGANVPIDLQDRAGWKQDDIFKGNRLIGYASAIPKLGTGRFYLEARIAQQHSNAESFESTNWPLIVDLYEQLISITSSPIAILNQAVAIAYAGNVSKAIDQVESVRDSSTVLSTSHLPDAVLAHLFAKKGVESKAYAHAQKAMQIGGTEHENKIMLAQITRLLT